MAVDIRKTLTASGKCLCFPWSFQRVSIFHELLPIFRCKKSNYQHSSNIQVSLVLIKLFKLLIATKAKHLFGGQEGAFGPIHIRFLVNVLELYEIGK